MVKLLLVTLCHNRDKLTAQALQSAVNQTYKDFVHLVIDNASTDNVPKICEVFTKKYSHIRYHRFETNMHQMPSYNWALEWAKENCPEAEVMVHLDSDDLLKAFALEEVNNIFSKHPKIGQTYSDFNVINGKGKLKIKAHPKAKMVNDQFTDHGQLILRRIFIKQNPIGHLRAMRVKCLRDIGGFDESHRFATDFNMAGKMLEKYPIVKIPRILYDWRQHDTQVERQHSPEQTESWKKLQAYYAQRWNEMELI